MYKTCTAIDFPNNVVLPSKKIQRYKWHFPIVRWCLTFFITIAHQKIHRIRWIFLLYVWGGNILSTTADHKWGSNRLQTLRTEQLRATYVRRISYGIKELRVEKKKKMAVKSIKATFSEGIFTAGLSFCIISAAIFSEIGLFRIVNLGDGDPIM